MIKKILILLFLLLITAYLIVAVTAFNTKPADQVCKGMELIDYQGQYRPWFHQPERDTPLTER